MKKVLVSLYIVYIFILVSGSAFAVGERTVSLGAAATWRDAENRTGITEARNVRPHPVLLLSSAANRASVLDLHVSFDARETGLFRDYAGHYRLIVPASIEAVDQRHARIGSGAALFNHSGPIVMQPQSRNALFAPGNRIRDFSIEFWLYPVNLENGEQILSWVAAGEQRITGTASRNRLHWSFANFFASPNGFGFINIEFSGNTPIIPGTWSHHLIRFDATTGMIEYLVNGSTEVIVYATATGRENAEVFTPIAGNGGSFQLGERFTGLMDEFKIHQTFAGPSSIQRYPSEGGRMETRPIDLGNISSSVIKIDVSGGRTSVRGTSNEFHHNGRFRFSDDSQMNFFIRASQNPFLLNNSQWINFTPGAVISGIQGRYVQIAVDFYPSADGETSPYLEQLHIVYLPGEPPMPPRNLTASAEDGAVRLRWRHSNTNDTTGYFVYYSSVRGELFGTDALQGPSPVNVGMTNNVLIDGLKNGTLYYFRVAAYNRITGEVNYNVGEFSAEVTARPLVGLSP